MKRPTDEILMAYADGLLDETSRMAVERYLLSDAVSQRFVHLMALVKVLSRQALTEQDFSRGLDRLVKRIECDAERDRRNGEPTALRRGSHRAGVLGLLNPWVAATASVSAIIICATIIAMQPGNQPSKTRDLALGAVPIGTGLWSALDTIGTEKNATTGPGSRRFQVVATLQDKFGQSCLELDAFDDRLNRLPTAMIVACRGRDETWFVTSAIATRSAQGDVYATDTVQAREAMSGVLQMLGAKRRTSSIKIESETQ